MNLMHTLFGLGVILMIFLFFSNGIQFFRTAKNGADILLPLGMLTFVSIFFGFVYGNIMIILERFRRNISKEINAKKVNINEAILKNSSPDLLDKSVADYKTIISLENQINPEKWLYLSVFSFLLAIISFMLKGDTVILGIIVDTKLIGSVIFHLGMVFTWFLLVSILSVYIIARRK